MFKDIENINEILKSLFIKFKREKAVEKI